MNIREVRKMVQELRKLYNYKPKYVLLLEDSFSELYRESEEYLKTFGYSTKVKAIGYGSEIALVVIIDGITFRVKQ